MPVERAGGDAEGGSNAAHGNVAKPVGIKQGKSGVDNTLAVYVHLGNCTDLAGRDGSSQVLLTESQCHFHRRVVSIAKTNKRPPLGWLHIRKIDSGAFPCPF